jgi:predicted sulfurtransferase
MIIEDEEFIPGECVCVKCGRVAIDEDDEDNNFIGCEDCGRMVCEKCVVNIEHQGYQESLCPKCVPLGSRKKRLKSLSTSDMIRFKRPLSPNIANSNQLEK